MNTKILFLVMFFSTSLFAEEVTPKKVESGCLSSREYITSFNYLRSKAEFQLSEQMIKKIADEISTGCTDASARFSSVVELLTKVGLSSKDAVETGTIFAKLTNAHRDSFVSIFTYAHVADFLDLDLGTALKVAKELSMNFPSEQLIIKKDFEAISKFCVSKEELDLPVLKCADLASKVAKWAAENKESLSQSFLEILSYLKSSKGPGLTTGDSLSLLNKILPYGVTGISNFKLGFEFATSQKGLALDAKNAIDFALKMTERTKIKN